MEIDMPVTAAAGAFEERYELRGRLWLDDSHQGLLAFDRSMGREVVVNIPYRPSDADPFLRSARLRAHLRHANLVPVYDLGATADGRPFFTEPYIDTSDLARLLRECERGASDVALARFASHLLSACKAVDFLHANGLLHLMLAPGRILIGQRFEEVFVSIDWHEPLSRARADGESAPAQVSGIAVGVLDYMAPEQADPGRLGAPGVPADVHGVGGILFRILYGEPPNRRKSAPPAEVVGDLVCRKRPPERGSFSASAAGSRRLARRLEPVCLRALHSDPAKRQGSVAALAAEIEHSLWR